MTHLPYGQNIFRQIFFISYFIKRVSCYFLSWITFCFLKIISLHIDAEPDGYKSYIGYNWWLFSNFYFCSNRFFSVIKYDCIILSTVGLSRKLPYFMNNFTSCITLRRGESNHVLKFLTSLKFIRCLKERFSLKRTRTLAVRQIENIFDLFIQRMDVSSTAWIRSALTSRRHRQRRRLDPQDVRADRYARKL